MIAARPSPKPYSARPALRVGAGVLLALASPAFAQRAGTAIVNVATAEAQVDGTAIRVASNPATLRLDEVLDIALAARANGLVTGGPLPAAPFLLTNAGNGSERFVLAGTIENAGAGAGLRGFAIDRNGDGVFDAGDTLLDALLTPALAPGEALALFALLDPATTGTALTIFARTATGSGAPGTVYSGRGDAGVDAIVGSTTAEATLRFVLGRAGTPGAALVKSQTVTAEDGTPSTIRRGAIVTYSLAARFDGAGAARAATVRDPIPAGTAYVPGSLSLDGVGLSDASDNDAGSFDGAQIAVALGDIATAQTRNIQFKVTIQ
jgi:uncharacterized repeat protein (TIGR01451 family)